MAMTMCQLVVKAIFK